MARSVFVERLVAAWEKNPIEPGEFAEKAGISPTLFIMIIGEEIYPGYKMALCLAKVLKTSLKKLGWKNPFLDRNVTDARDKMTQKKKFFVKRFKALYQQCDKGGNFWGLMHDTQVAQKWNVDLKDIPAILSGDLEPYRDFAEYVAWASEKSLEELGWEEG